MAKSVTTLNELFEGIAVDKIHDTENIELTGIACHTNDVEEGNLFICLPGYVAAGGEKRTDTHPFSTEATAKGAIALVCQQDRDIVSERTDIPIYSVPDTWEALSRCSSLFYGQPSKDLKVVGITGTNGKTTLAYLVESIFQYTHKNVGVISTINRRFKNVSIPSVNTTPEANKIHQFMRDALDHGVEHIIMEVTSHALGLGRVNDIEFDTCVFTNLSQDHLDYHGTMENYFKAKKKLIQIVEDRQGTIIANADDEHGRKLKSSVRKGRFLSFGIRAAAADIRALNINYSLNGTTFDVQYNHQIYGCFIPMIGEHYVSNALAALAVGISQCIDMEICVKALAETTVPGRSQFIPTDRPFQVVVDFAHTPDGVKKTLQSLKLANPRRIICIFGCGGNRDKTKRPQMGKIADQCADYIIVTSDNPRNEDPQEILRDIKEGISRDHDVELIEDRYEAIKRGLSIASANDLVIILGRGHEEYQTICGEKIPFSDVRVVEELLVSSRNHTL